MLMNKDEEALREMIKEDIMTKGFKIGDPAIEHLDFLLKNHYYEGYGKINAVRFYCMGYVAGVQSEQVDRQG